MHLIPGRTALVPIPHFALNRADFLRISHHFESAITIWWPHLVGRQADAARAAVSSKLVNCYLFKGDFRHYCVPSTAANNSSNDQTCPAMPAIIAAVGRLHPDLPGFVIPTLCCWRDMAARLHPSKWREAARLLARPPRTSRFPAAPDLPTTPRPARQRG